MKIHKPIVLTHDFLRDFKAVVAAATCGNSRLLAILRKQLRKKHGRILRRIVQLRGDTNRIKTTTDAALIPLFWEYATATAHDLAYRCSARKVRDHDEVGQTAAMKFFRFCTKKNRKRPLKLNSLKSLEKAIQWVVKRVLADIGAKQTRHERERKAGRQAGLLLERQNINRQASVLSQLIKIQDDKVNEQLRQQKEDRQKAKKAKLQENTKKKQHKQPRPEQPGSD